MIICPYCGTNYQAFQPNCKNCGAPLPGPAGQAAPKAAASYDAGPLEPPPAPRPVSDSYALRLMASDVWGIVATRYQTAMQTVRVLREGQATMGTITSVEQERNVRVNRQFPWTIDYQFNAGGQQHTGRVTTFNPPGEHLQPGRAAYVLYSPQAPERNALYPHP
jgi:hypothetical protein